MSTKSVWLVAVTILVCLFLAVEAWYGVLAWQGSAPSPEVSMSQLGALVCFNGVILAWYCAQWR